MRESEASPTKKSDSSMDQEERNDRFASFCWWSDGHNLSYQSPWLQDTISDLDKKVKRMVNIIENDGESFTKRAEMFHKRKPELIELVHDLHNSYRALAYKYNQLRFQIFRRVSSNQNLTAEAEETKPSLFNEDDQALITLKNDLTSSKDYDAAYKGDSSKELGRQMKWEELRAAVSVLMEENMKQQTELVKRNDEKRDTIKQLQARIERLMEENKTLKSFLSDKKLNQSQLSKQKGCRCIGNFQV